MTLLDDAPVVLEPEQAPRTLLSRLVPVLVVSALLGLIGTAGTWAALSASTDNPATFATGSLVLSNTVTGGTGTCTSDQDAGLGVNVSECDQLFAEAARRPGDEVGETVVLENVGTVDASTLAIYAPAACSDAAAVGTYRGSGTPDGLCSLLQLTIQEHSDSSFVTPLSRCAYPADALATCTFDPGATVADFVASHGGFGTALSTVDGLATGAADARYFRVAVKLPADAGNSVQGRAATFSLTWRIEP